MIKLELTDQEMEVVQNGMIKYRTFLEKKIDELNECSSHFFVNEGLMNEVRIEKEKFQKELMVLEKLFEKYGENTHE